MLAFLGLTFIAVSLLVAFTFIEQRSSKVRLLKSSPVVCVYNAPARYDSLPLKNYGIPIKIKQRSLAQVIFPKLTESGDLAYIYSWHDISDLEVPNRGLNPRDTKLNTILELAPLIKHHLQIEPNVSALKDQYRQIDKLAKLVAKSHIYAANVDTYEQGLAQIKNLVRKAGKLENVYVCLIREVLIGVMIADYNPESAKVLEGDFDWQYRHAKEEYQNMKEVASAYFQLLNESKNTQL